jgi:hypothetical protein
VITFGTNGNATEFICSGWSEPENGYTWSVGPDSTIRLPEADYTAQTTIEMACAFYMNERSAQQRIILSLDGHRFGNTTLRIGGTLAIRLPPSADRMPVLTIEHPDAMVPPSGDGRELAVAFRYIRVLQTRRPPVQIPHIGDAQAATSMTAADLAMCFESLGDDYELGFVQRALGAEPLGLLRFSSSRLESGIEGIDIGFSDILDDVTIAAEAGCSWEWITHINRYGMHAHTFVRQAEIGFDAINARERKRIGFSGWQVQ